MRQFRVRNQMGGGGVRRDSLEKAIEDLNNAASAKAVHWIVAIENGVEMTITDEEDAAIQLS